MSTVILKGRRSGIDPCAEAWLATTPLAGDTDAAIRLSRAIAPALHGFPQREPVDLARHCNVETEWIIELLQAGQVPTVEALKSAHANPPGMNSGECLRERRAESKHLQSIVAGDADTLGEMLAGEIAGYWAACGTGPTWHELWNSGPSIDWWLFSLGDLPDQRLARNLTFALLDKLGWIASNSSPRSLCVGRRFHTRFHGDHVSQAKPSTVGFLVARSIGIYRRTHGGASPDWADIAATQTDAKGIPLFLNALDGQAQQRWLETQGWICLVDNQLRRGERAKAETHRRSELKRATAALNAA
ncbi:hypothetical protein ACFRAQ_07730 [Nocardia sp. NPDC056611]|uniref:hypothetical protein n=1 Tax=Nocardia sp. NPDC056611 TaxID=3345877 RepID=UPI0036727A0E